MVPPTMPICREKHGPGRSHPVGFIGAETGRDFYTSAAIQSSNCRHGLNVLPWLLEPRNISHDPDRIAAPSGAFASSHGRCRYAFVHVICADVDALQAR